MSLHRGCCQDKLIDPLVSKGEDSLVKGVEYFC